MAGITEGEHLALFGLPLSDVQTEQLEGKDYQVQWFERARFELHPENQPPYNVLLGLLGNEIRTNAAPPQTIVAPLPQPTEAPKPEPQPVPNPAPPAPEPTRAPASNDCDPAYPGVCIPPPPPDLDCGDIPYRDFRVLPPDPHRFDRDKDGLGCET